MEKGARSDIDEDDFFGLLEDPVGNGFTNAQACDLQDLVAKTGEILHVHGGEHVDASVEQNLNVLPAAGTLRSGRIGVSEVIDNANFGSALQNRGHVHFIGVSAA